jgi:hypothetical protein
MSVLEPYKTAAAGRMQCLGTAAAQRKRPVPAVTVESTTHWPRATGTQHERRHYKTASQGQESSNQARATLRMTVLEEVVSLWCSRRAGFRRGYEPTSRRLNCILWRPLELLAIAEQCLGYFAVGTATASGKPLSVLPNPSVNRSANGKPPGPRYSAGLHFLQRGPGALPLSPGYLER